MSDSRKFLGQKRNRTVVKRLKESSTQNWSENITENNSCISTNSSNSTESSSAIISSESAISYEEDSNKKTVYNLKLNEFLMAWLTKYNIHRKASNILLKYININIDKSIPKTYTTLLGTPKESNIIPLHPGKYIHLGIVESLQKSGFNFDKFESNSTFYLDVNLDGVSVSIN